MFEAEQGPVASEVSTEDTNLRDDQKYGHRCNHCMNDTIEEEELMAIVSRFLEHTKHHLRLSLLLS